MAKRAHAVLCYGAAAALLAAIAADSVGLLTDRVVLWAAGARLMTIGVALATFAVLGGVFVRRSSRARTAALHTAGAVLGLLLLCLARWVRGHPEVRPDPPTFATEIIAGVALVALLRRIAGPMPTGTTELAAEPPSPRSRSRP